MLSAICFVALLHGFTPRLGVYVMNVSEIHISYSKNIHLALAPGVNTIQNGNTASYRCDR